MKQRTYTFGSSVALAAFGCEKSMDQLAETT
jgi:hypothetical protein